MIEKMTKISENRQIGNNVNNAQNNILNIRGAIQTRIYSFDQEEETNYSTQQFILPSFLIRTATPSKRAILSLAEAN
jgi:hypothetical protein